jgi:hypothetical protein
MKMPKGVYVRTEKAKEACRETCRKMSLSNKNRPRTPVELIALRKNAKNAREAALKLPRTQAQRDASRKAAYQMGLSNNADTIVKHHNDLTHGALRPDDVSYMSAREHNRFHAKLQCQTQERDSKGRFTK